LPLTTGLELPGTETPNPYLDSAFKSLDYLRLFLTYSKASTGYTDYFF
jgi:hypothetical protein